MINLNDNKNQILSPATIIQSNTAQSFELKSRVTTNLTTFPVPITRPTMANKVIAFDIMPNGSPSDNGTNGVAWFDACNSDVHNNENAVCANRLGIGLTRASIGIVNYNGASTVPLDFLMGSYTPITIQTTGYVNFGRKLYPSTPAQTQQNNVAIMAGVGVPSNSDGVNGDIYFRADGIGSTAIYQKRNGVWVVSTDTTSIGTVITWSSLQNATYATGYITNNGTIPSGGSSTVTIDATAAFSYVIDIEDAAQEGNVIYLEDTATNNFNWTFGNSLISHTYTFGNIIQVGAVAGNAGTSIYTIPALPIKLKVTKSGNDLIYSTSADNGLNYTDRYTHTGVLDNKTTIYLKTLFAIAGATKKIKVTQSP